MSSGKVWYRAWVLLDKFIVANEPAEGSLRDGLDVFGACMGRASDCAVAIACEADVSSATLDELYAIADTLDEAAYELGSHTDLGEAAVLIRVMDDLCDVIREIENLNNGTSDDVWGLGFDD